MNKENLNSLQFESIKSPLASEKDAISEISNIITWSDIKEETIFLHIDDVVLSDFIKQIKQQFQSISLTRDIELNIYRSADVPPVIKSDPKIFKEIIFRLADFAILHTQQAEVEIFFNTISKNKEKLIEIKVTCADTVDYIEDHVAVIKFLTQLLHGEIYINRKSVGGSFTTLLIPFNIITSSFHDINITKEESRLHDKKFLIAEDNFQNAKLFMQLLKNKNIICDHVFNGRKALERIENNFYDLIIMDLQMPEMNGLETIAALRSGNDKKANIPAIVVTADIDTGIREVCIQAGFDEFINKPFFPEEFFEKVLRILLKRNFDGDISGEDLNKKKDILEKKEELKNEVELDFSYLKAFSNGDQEFEKDMLISSLAEIEEKMEELRNWVLEKDVKEIKKSAHSLKSLSFIIGFNILHNHFKSLEGTLNEEFLPEISMKHLEDINDLWRYVKPKVIEEIEDQYG